MWYCMVLCGLLIPVICIIAGREMWKHCPKEINGVLGYRTKRSMKNLDTWRFAHEYCGRLWWRIGWVMLLPSMLVLLPFYHSTVNLIAIVGLALCTVQGVILLVSILPTEYALKRTFFEDGTRR